jgi:hypothetical protein
VREGFAGWLDKSAKHGAKLVLNEAGHIFAVVDHIVLHNSGQNGTERTFIIEAVIGLKSNKIGVGAFLGQVEHARVDLLVDLDPAGQVEHADQFMQHLVAAAERGDCVSGVGDLELLVEGLGLEGHLHES